jgi:predicted ATPase
VAGSGKTRLALAVADWALGVFHDGVWLVELSPLQVNPDVDPTAIVAATLAALDLREQPGEPTLDTLIDSPAA